MAGEGLSSAGTFTDCPPPLSQRSVMAHILATRTQNLAFPAALSIICEYQLCRKNGR